MQKENKKVYLIKGCYFDGDLPIEWIESVSLSYKKAKDKQKNLNNELVESLEKGGSIADRYLKSDPSVVEWNDRQYAVDLMDEDEYALFYLYRYKNHLPFKVYEVDPI